MYGGIQEIMDTSEFSAFAPKTSELDILTTSFKGFTHKVSVEGTFVYQGGQIPEGKSASISRTINYTTHLAKGILPIPGYPSLQLSWLGSEITFHNAPYDKYYGNFNGTIKVNDVEVFTGIVGDCCEFVYDTKKPSDYKLRIDEDDAGIINWYLYYGKDPIMVDLTKFTNSHWTIGPNPDPNNTAATGSGRIFSNRIPGWLMAFYHKKQGKSIPESFFDACIDWSSTQSLRADKLYLDNQLSQWAALRFVEDNVIIGHGYQEGGGPSDVWLDEQANLLGRITYYDKTKKRERPYQSMGGKYNDHLHFSNMQNIMIGLFCNKPSAIRNAIAMTESDFKHSIYDWFGAPRAFAGLIQSLAFGWAALYKYAKVDHWRTDYLPRILTKLENRNVIYDIDGDNFIAPCLDKGKMSKSDHMYISDKMRTFLSENYGVDTDEERYPYVAFWSTWQGGWLIEAILTVLELVPLSLDQYKRWSKQLKWAVHLTIFSAFKTPSMHFSTLEMGIDALGICDDYAPKQPFRKDSGHNTIVGVQIRFLQPALRHYYQYTRSRPELKLSEFNDNVLNDACSVIMKYCDKQKYWNTSDRLRAGLDHLFYEDGYLEKKN